ncbi:lipid-A-disaccharide synthase [Waterburya agarophytonicola K14]|uniref:Lipid-A-disaccharide synthase n=1 Tax=Waterburya agarophytonicola KI4 TaxID=2874699 RepID=A0A964FFQ8_9CYAN|nr:lipid-A-disaccharide synthase [Waterburya agarophytonicola]MCC0175693.1 lipid-A-disaccharide synthase [Waterburya agarophytonicola KI4]
MNDLVILSNGPGEVATWVRPVVKCLRQQLGTKDSEIRISVLLSPCPHSTGKEAAIALSYPEVDRVLSPGDFFNFLLWGKTKDNWQWRDQGIVVFLGGDQFYTVAIAQRLGYSSLIYAEWDARWYRFVDRFAVSDRRVVDRVPKSYHHKFSVVGDLMADVALEIRDRPATPRLDIPVIGLLVGSKPAKLSQGVPLCLAIAEKIHEQLPKVAFIIPVAPTLNLSTLSKYANSQDNPFVSVFGNVEGKLITSEDMTYIVTSGGTKIKLVTQFPAYEDLVDCQLCLTTVGANTAELTSLGIPMIVLLPTQQLDAMRSWDGLPGIFANLPGVGTILAKLINYLVLKQGRLFAWPNIWANSEIVPELVGKLQPGNVAQLAVDYLTHPNKLQSMQNSLIAVRGETGAAKQIADIIEQEVT